MDVDPRNNWKYSKKKIMCKQYTFCIKNVHVLCCFFLLPCKGENHFPTCVPRTSIYFKAAYWEQSYFGIAYFVFFNNKNNIVCLSIYIKKKNSSACSIKKNSQFNQSFPI